jgi:hypothetical protein
MRAVPLPPHKHINGQPIIATKFFQRITRVNGIGVARRSQHHTPMRGRKLAATALDGIGLWITAGHGLVWKGFTRIRLRAKPKGRELSSLSVANLNNIPVFSKEVLLSLVQSVKMIGRHT